MFGPTASPVVQAQSTWHIGPTTCVFTSRSRACRESVGSSEPCEPRRIAGSSSSIQRASAIASRGVGADEARGAGDPVGEHVRPDRPGRGRAARHRERQAALGVRERHVDVLLRAAGLDDGAVVRRARTRRARSVIGQAETGITATPVSASAAAGERLQVDRGDEAVDAEQLLARADRGGIVLPRPAHADLSPPDAALPCSGGSAGSGRVASAG